MSEYIVKGAEPNETVLHRRTPNGHDEYDSVLDSAAELRAENAKLKELVIRADKLMQGVLDNAEDTVVVSELPCCDTLLDNLEIYREDMRELGVEVDE